MTEYDHIPLQIFQLARPVQQWAKDRFPTARSPEKFFEETQAYVAKNPVDGEGKIYLHPSYSTLFDKVQQG